MSDKESTPGEMPDVERPMCEECGVEMWLLKVTREPTRVINAFECPVCQASAVRSSF